MYKKSQNLQKHSFFNEYVPKGFNTNLVQFLSPYHVIISNVHVCSFTSMITHAHGPPPKTVLRAQNLVHKKL